MLAHEGLYVKKSAPEYMQFQTISRHMVNWTYYGCIINDCVSSNASIEKHVGLDCEGFGECESVGKMDGYVNGSKIKSMVLNSTKGNPR